MINESFDAPKYWRLYLDQFREKNDDGVYNVSNLSRFIIAGRRAGVRIDAEDVREQLEVSGHCSDMHPSDANLFEEGLLSEVDAINATLDTLQSDFGFEFSRLQPLFGGKSS
jgi:hypothetical protein